MLITAGSRHHCRLFYTRCKTVCLTLGSSFNQLQAALAQDNPGVQLLSISFDGDHDTPNILRHYACPLGADPAIWRFARVADPHRTSRLAAPAGRSSSPTGLAITSTTPLLLVFDAQGRMVRVFDLAEQDLALNYAAIWPAKPSTPVPRGGMSQAPKLTYFIAVFALKISVFMLFC